MVPELKRNHLPKREEGQSSSEASQRSKETRQETNFFLRRCSRYVSNYSLIYWLAPILGPLQTHQPAHEDPFPVKCLRGKKDVVGGRRPRSTPTALKCSYFREVKGVQSCISSRRLRSTPHHPSLNDAQDFNEGSCGEVGSRGRVEAQILRNQ